MALKFEGSCLCALQNKVWDTGTESQQLLPDDSQLI